MRLWNKIITPHQKNLWSMMSWYQDVTVIIYIYVNIYRYIVHIYIHMILDRNIYEGHLVVTQGNCTHILIFKTCNPKGAPFWKPSFGGFFFSHKSFKKPNILVSPSILRLTNQRISKLEKFTFNFFFLTDTVVICYEGCSSPFATGAAIHRLSPLPAMTSRTLFDASKSNHKKCHTTESNVKMRGNSWKVAENKRVILLATWKHSMQ